MDGQIDGSRRGGELTAPGDTWLGRPRMVLLRRPRGDATVTLRLGPGIPASIQTHEVETVAP